MDKSLLEIRDYKVVKANDLIQKARFNLSQQEQKIVLYLISKIKPEDKEFQEFTFDIAEFCRVCGVGEDKNISGGNYEAIRNSIKTLADKSAWILIDKDTEALLRWIDKALINKTAGKVRLRIHEDMKPFLLRLRDCYTQYELYNVIAMRSKYSSRIYEILKSHEFRKEPISINLDELKRNLFATQYKRFPDFRRYVIEIAMREINEFSDLKVSYEAESSPGSGRGITTIVFHVEFKSKVEERLVAFTNIEKRLNPKEIPGQISLATTSKLL